jgi:hypothetical protein
MAMPSVTGASTWRVQQRLWVQIAKGAMAAAAHIRARLRQARGAIRVSRLSNDWVQRHEIESWKRNPSGR